MAKMGPVHEKLPTISVLGVHLGVCESNLKVFGPTPQDVLRTCYLFASMAGHIFLGVTNVTSLPFLARIMPSPDLASTKPPMVLLSCLIFVTSTLGDWRGRRGSGGL